MKTLRHIVRCYGLIICASLFAISIVVFAGTYPAVHDFKSVSRKDFIIAGMFRDNCVMIHADTREDGLDHLVELINKYNFEPTKIGYNEGNNVYCFSVNYFNDVLKDRYRCFVAEQKYISHLNKLLPENPTADDKIKAIITVMLSDVVYSTDEANLSLVSCLEQGTGCCTLFAHTVKVLCDSCGLENAYCLAYTEDNKGSHIFNYIKLDDETWRVLDTATLSNNVDAVYNRTDFEGYSEFSKISTYINGSVIQCKNLQGNQEQLKSCTLEESSTEFSSVIK